MYKNRTPYYWAFVILFLSVLGCLIYILTQVYNRRDAEKIQEGIISVVNPTKRIKDLEHKLQFSETYQNRVNLADAYLDIQDNQNAITHYLEALEDTSQNNFYVYGKLIEAFYNTQDYKSVIAYAEKIKNQPEFGKSRIQFLYGLAQSELGNYDVAEANLRAIDIRYSFYEERLTLAKFLLNRQKNEDAKLLLDEIHTESQNMTKPNKKRFKSAIIEVEKLLQDLKLV
ncbi:hypothetical protein JF259_08415 [Snuella sp. CAU 1569]|uniref:26S proteasome regulatory subunit Rpn7 N-terminal domain-containing protein n=2 Tax=Snuella sedimenti TaxID=2798802 RepID=A0A8J7IW44_9FLAO|nr:hypothetical protein [Snuella sedimenti]